MAEQRGTESSRAGALRRYICCFSGGGTCERPSKKVSNSDPADSNPNPSGAGPRSSKESPILVEHFTSQGCSSCPPADLLISQLGRGKSPEVQLQSPIILLSFHVEYWDYLGWKDPFASSAWTLRQRNYGQALQQDSIYTPEIVVQGRSHCIASGLEPILALIHDAPRFPAPEISKASYKLKSDPLALDVSMEILLRSKAEHLDVMFALYENGLVTSVERGENKGRVLVNDFVVRSMAKATSLDSWPVKKPVKVEFSLPLWTSFSRSSCGAVVFLQNPSTMEIFGAQSLVLPEELGHV